MKTAESKTTTTVATTAAKTPTYAFFSQEPERTTAFFSSETAEAAPFFSPRGIQPKLTIGRSNDHYEQQADAVADQVVAKLNAPSPLVQPKCDLCEQEEKLQKKEEDIASIGQQVQRKPVFDSAAEPPPDDVQRKTEGNTEGEASSDLSSQLNASKGGGQPLPDDICTSLESAIGANFSNVRVHTDSEAVQMSQSINAQAFTHGSDVYFNEGKYNPSSTEGTRLLAHELTHTVQQDSSDGNVQRQVTEQQRSSTTPSTARPAASCEPSWGPFEIRGSNTFICTVRSNLDILWRYPNGRGLINAIIANRRGILFFVPIVVSEDAVCAYDSVPDPDRIYYNTSSCVSTSCSSDHSWLSVDNCVYLHHEIAHGYLHIIGHGDHSERECMATGLGSYFTSIPFNENRLRCEMGLPMRPCYGTECSGMSVPTCGTPVPPTRTQAIQQKGIGNAVQRKGENQSKSLSSKMPHPIQQVNLINRFDNQIIQPQRTTVSTPETPIAPTECGHFRFSGSNWDDASRSLVCQAFERIPPIAQQAADGLTFFRHDGLMRLATSEGGHYFELDDSIHLQCVVFNSCIPPQFQDTDQKIQTIVHEIGHAIDLRPLNRTVLSRSEQEAQAGVRALLQPDIPEEDSTDPIGGLEELERTTRPSETSRQRERELRQARSELSRAIEARRQSRSLSGIAMLTEQEQYLLEHPRDRSGASTQDDTQTREVSPAGNSFQEAARLDGVADVALSEQRILNDGTDRHVELSGGPSSYSNTNWMEMYAEAFSMYILRPTDLQEHHPHIFAYFATRFTTSTPEHTREPSRHRRPSRR